MSKDKKAVSKNVPTTKAPTRSMWLRSVIVMVILIGVGFTSITYKLTTIQIVNADTYRQAAIQQQMSDSIISPKRGAIYDVNGDFLAQSATVWTVIMSPKDIKTEEARALIADELSAMLDLDRDKLYERTGKTYSQYEIIKRKIEKPMRDEVAKWVGEHSLAGVIRMIEDYKRYYPGDNLLSTVLGFTGTENTGLYGLEAYYESTLAGKAGRVITAKNARGDDMPNKMKFEKTIGAEDGKSLVLTIDRTVQYYAEKHLEQAVKEQQCNNRGACIIMEVETGAIVAMATKGDFNPNEPMTVASPDTAAAIAQMAGDEQSKALKDAREYQWTNKPVFDFYEPGSVFKTFTSAAALEENIFTDSARFVCNGSYKLPGGHRAVSCHYKAGHGSQTFTQALLHSCNPAFMQIGTALGRTKFFKYYQAFGFTDLTGIDMESEQKPTTAIYHTEDKLNAQELAIAAFGQRIKVTPIQMITAMSAVANGGYLMEPYVVGQILNPDGSVFQNHEPVVKRQVISEETSRQLSAMLGLVVSEPDGGGKNAKVPGYRMGGKTGTSEKLDVPVPEDNRTPAIASFGGIAPSENPKYAILVMLDEPRVQIRFGGTIAAPLAATVFADALPYLGVEPKYTEAEQSQLETVTPNVKDKPISEAKTIVTSSKLTPIVVGDGETVLRQVPENGKTIPKNGMVVLYTSEDKLATTTTVPNFAGLSLSQANILAAEHKINLQIAGLGLDTEGATGGSQSLAAGEKVAPGTVVKVTFLHKSTD